jgi:hypothetical protein
VGCPAQSLAPLLSCESKRDSPVLGEQAPGRIDLAASTDASATSPSSDDQQRSGRDGGGTQPTRLPASGHSNALPAPGSQSMSTCLRPESTQISNANRLPQHPSISFAMCDSRLMMLCLLLWQLCKPPTPPRRLLTPARVFCGIPTTTPCPGGVLPHLSAPGSA